VNPREISRGDSFVITINSVPIPKHAIVNLIRNSERIPVSDPHISDQATGAAVITAVAPGAVKLGNYTLEIRLDDKSYIGTLRVRPPGSEEIRLVNVDPDHESGRTKSGLGLGVGLLTYSGYKIFKNSGNKRRDPTAA
jgi:hypothetical protein